MRVLTTAEAARRVGVEPATVRQWQKRGHLAPVREGAKPSLFREEDLISCHEARLSEARKQELNALADQFLHSPPVICHDSA